MMKTKNKENRKEKKNKTKRQRAAAPEHKMKSLKAAGVDYKR